MGTDQIWGGMFIKSDLQFQKSKAFLSVHASERDFLGVKSFILCQEDLWGLFYCREDREKKQVIYLSIGQSTSQKREREPILASTFSANEWAWETGARSKFLYDEIADIPEITEGSSIDTKHESSSLTHKAPTMGPSAALLPWLSAYRPAWPLPKAVKKLLLLHPLFSSTWRCQSSTRVATKKRGNLQNAGLRIRSF